MEDEETPACVEFLYANNEQEAQVSGGFWWLLANTGSSAYHSQHSPHPLRLDLIRWNLDLDSFVLVNLVLFSF